MLKRTVTGAIYVATIVVFFLLRNHVDYRLFDVLTFLFCAVGTFEVARAVKAYLFKGIFALSVFYGAAFVPVFCIFEFFIPFNGVYACLIAFAAAIIGVFIAAAFSRRNGDGGSARLAFNFLPFFYPAPLLLNILCANGLQNGFICLLLIFVVSPCADTFAYLVGMTYNKIRKGKAKKMCPVLSPKKTWAGAIGGVIGGAVGAIVVYLLADKTGFAGAAVNPFIVFLIIGIIASVLTEIGDLFESFIKRKVGLKDMGKILPGHGGVMDRIDGMVFAAVFIYAAFAFLL